MSTGTTSDRSCVAAGRVPIGRAAISVAPSSMRASRSSSTSATTRGRSRSAAIDGSSSPATPTTRSPTRTSAVRPGCRAGCDPARERRLDREGEGELAHGVERVGQARRHRGGAGLLGQRVAEEQRADAPALRRDAGRELRERRVVGALGSDRDEVGAGHDAGLGTEHGADLEQREVGEPAGQVAAGGLEQAGQQRAAQQRELRVEGVREADRRRAGLEALDGRLRHERIGRAPRSRPRRRASGRRDGAPSARGSARVRAARPAGPTGSRGTR